MPMTPLPGPPAIARRELRREEMAAFGPDIEWLQDPGLIPESATAADNPYLGLAVWMLKKMGEWSAGAHRNLSYGSVFARNALPHASRVAVRNSLREDAESSYGVGIVAMSEIYEVVPRLAMRQAIHDPVQWGATASLARLFGRELGHHGANTLTLVREYLIGGYVQGNDITRYDPGKLKLDEKTGITTVTPLEEIIKTVPLVADEMLVNEGHSGVCLAFQTVPDGTAKKSMFDVFWDAYGTAVARDIYPKELIKPADEIPAMEPPDENLRSTLQTQAYRWAMRLS